MEILSVVRVTPNCAESAPVIIGIFILIAIFGMYFSAYCFEKYEINYAAIGALCIICALIVTYMVLGLMQTSPIEAKIRINNDISVQEYQNMVKDLDTYTLEKDILTIRMSEQDFYRWHYERHEATISASSSSSIESKDRQ